MDLAIGNSDERRRARVSPRIAAIALVATILIGWAASPSGLFTVDEYFYLRAAEAMANAGALDFRQFDVAGAPALDMTFAKPSDAEGRLAPQYPSGYALLAAPFYAMLGIKGLTLLNALSGFLSLWLTLRIARALGADAQTSLLALAILALATFWSTYLYAVWPHMLALAIMLGVVDRAIKAGEGDIRAAIAAGFLTGLGQNVRIDMIVLAPAVVVWLRLFCSGPTRFSSVLFTLALTPGLAIAAWTNLMKFGVFNPFTYDNAVASNDPSAFTILAAAAAAGVFTVVTFDCRKALRAPAVRAALAGLILLALIAIPQIRALPGGYWYALIDAQSYQHLDRQIGIERNEWGWLVFYGFSKKALAESLPFIALLTFPIVRLFRGAMTRGEGLLFLVMGAVATLYSFNQTDSGLGLNARFLIPLLPPAAILCVIEFRRLAHEGQLNSMRSARLALIAFTGFLALRFSILSPGALAVPLDLYPQLALAAGLAALSLLHAVRPSAESAGRVASLAALTFGAAAAISATDLIRDQAYRSHIEKQAALYGAELSVDGLVFTAQPILFAKAAANGLGVAYPGLAPAAEELTVVGRYQETGRCVYAHGEEASERLSGELGLSGALKSLGPAFAQGGIWAAGGNPAECP